MLQVRRPVRWPWNSGAPARFPRSFQHDGRKVAAQHLAQPVTGDRALLRRLGRRMWAEWEKRRRPDVVALPLREFGCERPRSGEQLIENHPSEKTSPADAGHARRAIAPGWHKRGVNMRDFVRVACWVPLSREQLRNRAAVTWPSLVTRILAASGRDAESDCDGRTPRRPLPERNKWRRAAMWSLRVSQ